MLEWSAEKIATTVLIVMTVGVVAPISQAQPTPMQTALPDAPQVLNTAAGRIRVVPIKGLVYPWALAFLPNGDMLVTEQSRTTLRRIRGDVLDPTPITGLPPSIESPRRDTAGVDIAVHPDFSENRLVYVAFWKPIPEADHLRTAVVIRAHLDGHQLTDVREIFESVSWTDGPSAVRVIFGPDGKLYLAIGAPGFKDTLGETTWAQDPDHHGGKILRLNGDGTVPDDNPFVGQPGYLPELFAVGIRNAIGLTFHPDTGQLWETEHGPQGGDEINIIRPGLNYGWPVVTYGRAYSNDPEGARSGLPPPTVQPPTSAPGMEEPFTYYKPSIAIAGMTFYTGDKFPEWTGDLFAGGLAGTQLSRVIFNPYGLESRRQILLHELGQRIRDVKQGPDGFLYLTTDMQDGAVLRLEPAP
ncbi:MAG: PQQ-dependent sugar dehydrogenase [Acidobacteriota bacterium]|nr:PQQ-dependent sugar dehydrogenase [Acidobacteriota bacterium]